MADQFRIEKDSLGEMKVPADALYGPQTQRAVENFPISGQRFGRRFIQALGWIKRAAAEANMELGTVDDTIGTAIVKAANEVADGRWDDQFVVDIYQTGSGTSTNMNTNEVVARRATEIAGGDTKVHPNDHVNFGQSSNDVIPTAIHVASRVAIEKELLPALEHLRAALAEKADAFDGVLKSGRTHLMDATPVRLGQEFRGYATQVAKGMERVRTAAAELRSCPWAVPPLERDQHPRALRGRHHPPHRRGVGRALPRGGGPLRGPGGQGRGRPGSRCPQHRGHQLHEDRRRPPLAGVRTHVGIYEIRVPAIQPGSSIMPGKVNPVLSEAMMMVAARVMGNHATVTVAGSRGNFELNVMMPCWRTLSWSPSRFWPTWRGSSPTGVSPASRPTRTAHASFSLNPSIATALNPYIGYDAAAEVAKESAKRGVSVRQVVLERKLLPEDQVDAALDVRGMTEPGLPE